MAALYSAADPYTGGATTADAADMIWKGLGQLERAYRKAIEDSTGAGKSDADLEGAGSAFGAATGKGGTLKGAQNAVITAIRSVDGYLSLLDLGRSGA